MPRTRVVLSAATIVAAFWLSGCSPDSPPAATNTMSAPAPVATAPAALPEPVALLDVLNKLADPAVPGADKVSLVEAATADSAVTLDQFTKALQDNGNLPLTFAVTDIAWSDKDPGNAVANVAVTTANPVAGNNFSFPMEFRPYQDGWQLARETADLLLSFGAAGSTTGPAATTAAPTTTPTR